MAEMRSFIRRRGVAPTALGVLLSVVAVTQLRPGERSTLAVSYVVSMAAAPTDGAAYAREAIQNVRGMERFRFTQAVSGVGSALDPASGTVDGEVDQSAHAGDPPRFKSRVQLKDPKGGDASVDQLVVDDELHLRAPKQTSFMRQATKARKAKGKSVGGDEVAVVDPVMVVLESVDNQPDTVFGPPSQPDGDGNRVVPVTLPAGVSVELAIDDANRLVERVVYTRDGTRATFALSAFGNPGIVIQEPS